MPPKAHANDFPGRFREILSDPLNLLIARHPLAGTRDGELVVLHNGLRVPLTGETAYYGPFSAILELNRGVHEPLEEFVFQEMIARLAPAPVMLELGAYWGHYSMWLKLRRPRATVFLVEPEAANLDVGQRNFASNRLAGTFIQARVGQDAFTVDDFLASQGLEHLDILHADIQGAEAELLDGCREALRTRRIDHLCLSTHSQALHEKVTDALDRLDYRVEVSSDFDNHTTAFDGFVYAANPDGPPPLFTGIRPLSRQEITRAGPAALVAYLGGVLTALP